jgi:hypothetical protein
MEEAYMAVVGFMIGAVLMTGAAVIVRDQGRAECERKLPRTEKCVQQWVPQAERTEGGA